MASHLPSWNLLCSTSFIKLTSRKPSWHHFLIHPAYSFLQHPSFLFTVVLYITIFKIHLFCDATLSTDCYLYGLYASLLHTHMWWKNHYFHDGFCLKVQILSLLKRNLSKSLKEDSSTLKKLHCVQQGKDTDPTTISSSYRVIPRVLAPHALVYPSSDWPPKFVFF